MIVIFPCFFPSFLFSHTFSFLFLLSFFFFSFLRHFFLVPLPLLSSPTAALPHSRLLSLISPISLCLSLSLNLTLSPLAHSLPFSLSPSSLISLFSFFFFSFLQPSVPPSATGEAQPPAPITQNNHAHLSFFLSHSFPLDLPLVPSFNLTSPFPDLTLSLTSRDPRQKIAEPQPKLPSRATSSFLFFFDFRLLYSKIQPPSRLPPPCLSCPASLLPSLCSSRRA